MDYKQSTMESYTCTYTYLFAANRLINHHTVPFFSTAHYKITGTAWKQHIPCTCTSVRHMDHVLFV